MRDWLRFFRFVNLPTVPGDVLCGAAALGTARSVPGLTVAAACAAACALYLFGMADNDIVGAPTDVGRPIPEGKVSLTAARIARGLSLFAALVVGAVANLPPAWWIVAFVLSLAIVAYNRTKSCLLMGLCRGLDVLCGAAVGAFACNWCVPLAVAAVWMAYVAAVTKYSEGEELDAARKRRVGFLIGALVYLQLSALLVFQVRPYLIVGAVLLVLLRLLKRVMPHVSAS